MPQLKEIFVTMLIKPEPSITEPQAASEKQGLFIGNCIIHPVKNKACLSIINSNTLEIDLDSTSFDVDISPHHKFYVFKIENLANEVIVQY